MSEVSFYRVGRPDTLSAPPSTPMASSPSNLSPLPLREISGAATKSLSSMTPVDSLDIHSSAKTYLSNDLMDEIMKMRTESDNVFHAFQQQSRYFKRAKMQQALLMGIHRNPNLSRFLQQERLRETQPKPELNVAAVRFAGKVRQQARQPKWDGPERLTKSMEAERPPVTTEQVTQTPKESTKFMLSLPARAKKVVRAQKERKKIDRFKAWRKLCHEPVEENVPRRQSVVEPACEIQGKKVIRRDTVFREMSSRFAEEGEVMKFSSVNQLVNTLSMHS